MLPSVATWDAGVPLRDPLRGGDRACPAWWRGAGRYRSVASRVPRATAKSDAWGGHGRASRVRPVPSTGLRDLASTAGPVEPDPCKSDGPEPDSQAGWSACLDAAWRARALRAASPAAPPYRALAARLDELRVGRLDSVLRADAADRRHPRDAGSRVARARTARVDGARRAVSECSEPATLTAPLVEAGLAVQHWESPSKAEPSVNR